MGSLLNRTTVCCNGSAANSVLVRHGHGGGGTGASLEFRSGMVLPGVAALTEK
jgi:3-phosphoglycerate kinase